ncbi:MAG: DNA mismatch repair protein MutS [Peptococcaceae bacterium BICA1-8]|nr:MAG: DNA mismatch repair protein MutS [Peptococcaceae bacterium BICA1-8]
MMIQYQEIKSQYQDSILFYRLGDFYEMFGPDALLAAKLLEIALTSREAGKGNRVPMCGIPYHSADNYIAKLINKGYKVAICEQVEDPKECKGIVKREVVRIITPGTVLENNILKEKANNYLVAIVTNKKAFGLAAADISTGDFYATEISDSQSLINEILRFNPAECIISQRDLDYLEKIGAKFDNILVNKHLDYAFQFAYCEKILLEHFNVNSLHSLGCSKFPLAVMSAGAIIDYLMINHKVKPRNIAKLKIYHLRDSMFLDYATKRNLELTQSLHTLERKDSLLGIIDYTVTALGGRMLKNWVEQPLLNKQHIKERLETTGELVNNHTIRKKIKNLLYPIYDLERITARVSFGSANAKDLISLKISLELLPEIRKILSSCESQYLLDLNRNLDTLDDVLIILDKALEPDAPFSLREGNLIKDSYDQEVDRLRLVTRDGKKWIVDLEQKEKEKSGIKSLKVGFNKVFGYYLEITKSNMHLAPEYYIRKQTLANAERFITPELKELEAQVLGADERLKELEYQIFIAIRENIKEHIPRILLTAKILGELDCLTSLAEAAVTNNLVCPEINENGVFELIKCRHPVVEAKLEGQWFIPNDLYLDTINQRFLIITGPNMAGKSTYCRSVALVSILMQIGSFVPCEKASLSIVDRVFARIGASDDLSTGQSTFMVEMNEVANIVNHATLNSLIILDEVGRGTSTYDGLSIAWSLTEYINNNIQAKTLFATHYHELTKLEEKFPGIKNFSIAIQEEGDHIVFLHKIIAGGADRSYGIQVAKLAGLPEEIIARAKEILSNLELDIQQQNSEISIKREKNIQGAEITKGDVKNQVVIDNLLKTDLLNLTPIQALNLLYELQNQAKK